MECKWQDWEYVAEDMKDFICRNDKYWQHVCCGSEKCSGCEKGQSLYFGRIPKGASREVDNKEN